MPELPDNVESNFEATEKEKKLGGCTGKGFMPGQSGNPGGRKKLPEEIKAIKEEALEKAIMILADTIKDEAYMKKLNVHERTRLLEIVYDRFGLPKVTESKIEVTDNTNLAERIKEAQERAGL